MQEWWRFFSYCLLLPASAVRTSIDVAKQLLVGLPLELVYGPGRVFAVFVSATLAASLSTCLFEPENDLLRGGAAGCNALIVGVVANWAVHGDAASAAMWVKTVALLALLSADLGLSVFEKYSSVDAAGASSYRAGCLSQLFSGLAIGATVGFAVFSSFEQQLRGQFCWWLAVAAELLALVALLVVVATGKNKRFIY